VIHRLRRVTEGLFRGSGPNPKDVMWLKEILGIKKIVSLDKDTGDKIDRSCKLLGIEHVKAYIDNDRKSLYHVLGQNLKSLLLDNGPTYVHCHEGKDRTGLIVALFKCKYMGMNPDKAIEEAKSLGFGVGIDPKVTHLYEKIIRSCKPSADSNSASVVDNEREYISDNRDTYLDESRQDSWAPYLDHTRQDPMDAVYVYNNDQSPTRQNYDQTWEEPIKRHEDDAVPQVGVFNNDAGARGFGPTENYSGFFYD
jgi:protein tyrosine/serine phosphatase